ncbi:MAG: DUF1127 domain-containing protein [Rhodospirillaceae bacterium]
MALAFHRATTAAPEPALLHLWHEVGETIHRWHDRALSRRELAGLDDSMLQDIGLTRADAEEEVDKPFWRA